nr:hypothetical protein [Tanacetum cinerariifolium]
MEILFTINPRPHPTVNANTIVESIPSSLIPIQDNDSQREEIDIVTNTDEVLPLCVENDDDSEREIDAVEELRVDNSISNSENELSDNEESDFVNPSFPRPLSEPPDAEFDFEPDTGDEISVVMNTIHEQTKSAATNTSRNKETNRKDQQEHQRQQDHGTAASGLRSNITINEFKTSLPVAVCSGLVNTSSVRRWCIDDHVVLSKLPTVNGFDLSLPRVLCSWTSQLFTHRVI